MVCLNCAMGVPANFVSEGPDDIFFVSSIVFHRAPYKPPGEAIRLPLEGVRIRISKETYSHL